MQGYLLIAHGSRRQRANDEFKQQVEQVRLALGLTEQQILACFLELSEPSIQQGLATLHQRGASHIKILPCFLNQGKHVAEDVPSDINDYCQQHPELRVEQLPYLGSTSQYLQLVASSLQLSEH